MVSMNQSQSPKAYRSNAGTCSYRGAPARFSGVPFGKCQATNTQSVQATPEVLNGLGLKGGELAVFTPKVAGRDC